MRIYKHIRKGIALLLCLILTAGIVPAEAFAANYQDSLAGWKVQAYWSDLSRDMTWDARGKEMRQPKLVIAYSIGDAARAFAPGELRFTIDGIGSVYRNDVIKASDIAAGKDDSDWDLAWDKSTDTYTFTNRFNVSPGDSMSGSFEMLWTIDARAAVNGYKKTITPRFFCGQESIELKPLSFAFTSERDNYKLLLNSRKLSGDEYASADSAYTWYAYELRYDKATAARGLYRSSTFISLELPAAGSAPDDAIVMRHGSQIALEQVGGKWGFYLSKDRYGDAYDPGHGNKEAFWVGYRTAVLEGGTAVVTAAFEPYFNDEPGIASPGPNDSFTVSSSRTIQTYGYQSSGFTFGLGIGHAGDYEGNDHLPPSAYGDRLISSSLFTGKSILYGISGALNMEYSEVAPSPQLMTSGIMSYAGIAIPEILPEEAAPLPPSDTGDIEIEAPVQPDIDIPDDSIIMVPSPSPDPEPSQMPTEPSEEPVPVQLLTSVADGPSAEVTLPPPGETDVPTAEPALPGETPAPTAEPALPSLTPAPTAEPSETPMPASTPGPTQPSEEPVPTPSPSAKPLLTADSFSGDMILGIDRITVSLMDGTLRYLESSEYDISCVAIPAFGNGQHYSLYIANDTGLPFSSYTLSQTGDMDAPRTVYLPKGIKAFYLAMGTMDTSITKQVDLIVDYHLDQEKETEKPLDKQVDPEGIITSYGYMRFVDELGNDRIAASADKYAGTFGPTLAQHDMDTYGMYLLRNYSNVYTRGAAAELRADMSAIRFETAADGSLRANISTAAAIKAEESMPIERLSVITRLPAGLWANVYEDSVSLEGTLTTQSGVSMTDLSYNMNYDQYTDPMGRMVIVADLDLSGDPMEAGNGIKLKLTYPVSLTQADLMDHGNSYFVESFVIPQDTGLARYTGPLLRQDVDDLDRDGDTRETAAYDDVTGIVKDSAKEYRDHVNLSVKSKFSARYDKAAAVMVSGTTAPEDSEYRYRLEFGIGGNSAKDIVIYDRIDQGAGSSYQGTLQALDTKYVDALGLVPTVYWSADPAQSLDLKAAGWERGLPEDLSPVRSIAVALDSSGLDQGMLPRGSVVILELVMTAPTGKEPMQIGPDTKAVNSFTAEYTIVDPMDSSVSIPTSVQSATTEVYLRSKVAQIILKSVDGDELIGHDPSGKPIYPALPGTELKIYDEHKRPVFDKPLTMSASGRLILKNMEAGLYYWEQISAPQGYEKAPGLTLFSIDGVQKELEIKNRRIPGTVTLKKIDADMAEGSSAPGGDMVDLGISLAGAVFELYTADGVKVATDAAGTYSDQGDKYQFTTDNDGKLTISGLPWGSYCFKEVTAPLGYELDSQDICFVIDRSVQEVTVTASDREIPGGVVLTKHDAEDSSMKLQGAKFSLERLVSWKWEQATAKQFDTTNKLGEIKLDGLLFGKYRLREVQPPSGYKANETTIEFTIGPKDAGKLQHLSHDSQRILGSAALLMLGEDGGPLSGAEYTIYRKGKTAEEDVLVKDKLVTGSDGKTALVEDLIWGDYYFLQVKAPMGYALYEEAVELKIFADNASAPVTVEATGKRLGGSVTLTKTNEYSDEADKILLQGAEFSLCKEDGTAIETGLVTDDKGQITVEDLAWGSYYFQETKAPDGYSLNDDMIRFSVNAANCSKTQQLSCTNAQGLGQITIEAQVDERYEPFGDPSFVFQISGTTKEGKSVSYVRSVHLADMALSGSVSLTVPYGNYKVVMLPVSRYVNVGIQPGVLAEAGAEPMASTRDRDHIGGTNNSVEISANGNAKLIFINEMKQYEAFSHVTSMENIVAARTKLTALSVDYIGPAVIQSHTGGRYTFTALDLIATAHYDDGSSRIIPFDPLILDPPSVTSEHNSSGAGYTVNVSYTDGGITASDSFSVVIDLPIVAIPRTVTYDANGGYFDGNTALTTNVVTYLSKPSGTTLQSGKIKEPQHLSAHHRFDGWYTTKDCAPGTEYVYDAGKPMDSDIVVYAKWIREDPQAVFVDGPTFNAVIIELSSPNSARLPDAFNFGKYPSIPENSILETAKVVSDPTRSNVPIYMWNEGRNIYWWSEDPTPKVAENASGMFKNVVTSGNYGFLEIGDFDTSETTNMSSMFQGCNRLTDLSGLANWNTSAVTDMSSMFDGCTSLTSASVLNKWDVRKVSTMESMFGHAKNLQTADLPSWSTPNLQNTSGMFNMCYALSHMCFYELDMSNVTNKANMFSGTGNYTTPCVIQYDSQRSSGLVTALSTGTGMELSKFKFEDMHGGGTN